MSKIIIYLPTIIHPMESSQPKVNSHVDSTADKILTSKKVINKIPFSITIVARGWKVFENKALILPTKESLLFTRGKSQFIVQLFKNNLLAYVPHL